MAQIVLIAKGTERVNLAYIGDIVDICEDDVKLGGIGYRDFKIIQVPGIKAEVIEQMQRDAEIETRRYRKSGKIEAETAAGVFEEIKTESKYRATLKDLSTTDILAVESKEVSNAVTEATLKSKMKCCTLEQIETLKISTIETKS